MKDLVVEICVDSVESAVAAEKGGADRIELCSDLLEGGITPSAGLISTVRSKVSLDVYVMIRPRGGDFCYSAEEFQIMEQDVVTAKQLGAQGIAFGILNEDGMVDTERTRRLVEAARPLQCTFHRAFDMSRELSKSLEDVVGCGVDRVLTSGGEAKVGDGIAAVARLVKTAQNRVAVMIGGGIDEGNVYRLLSETGAREVHATMRSLQPSPMRHRNEKISMGSLKGREFQRMAVSPERVRRLLQAATSGQCGLC